MGEKGTWTDRSRCSHDGSRWAACITRRGLSSVSCSMRKPLGPRRLRLALIFFIAAAPSLILFLRLFLLRSLALPSAAYGSTVRRIVNRFFAWPKG